MRVLSVLLILSLLGVLAAPLTTAQNISDDKIYDNVKLKLAADTTVRGGGFEIEVKQGVVTLRGKVRREKQKERATRLTKKVKGVTQVVNELVVTP